MMKKLARAIVNAASVFVPRWRRDDWRREWHAELWYAPRDAVRLSTGAVPHALQLLQQHWSLDMVMQDIRYGCRMLRRNPAFAIVASLTLALGIGATTAIFSIVNAVLWRDLPYRDATRLVQLWETNPDRHWTDAECSPANLADWRRENQSFEDMAAYFGRARDAWVRNFALTGAGEPERLSGMTVTANFFSVLGVQPAFGLGFLPAEEWDGRDEAIISSAGLWGRRFAGDPAIVGRTLSLDGRTRTVVGVLPPDFRFNNAALDVWVPMGWTPQSIASTRRPHYLRVIARLKPAVSVPQAQGEMQRIAKDLERRYPETTTPMGVGVAPARQSRVREVTTSLRGSARQGGALAGSRMRHALVAAELALSLALLVSATLLARSFVKLNGVDLGFTPSQAVSVQVVLPRSAYAQADDQRAFVDRMLERVRALPGVMRAGA